MSTCTFADIRFWCCQLSLRFSYISWRWTGSWILFPQISSCDSANYVSSFLPAFWLGITELLGRDYTMSSSLPSWQPDLRDLNFKCASHLTPGPAQMLENFRSHWPRREGVTSLLTASAQDAPSILSTLAKHETLSSFLSFLSSGKITRSLVSPRPLQRG